SALNSVIDRQSLLRLRANDHYFSGFNECCCCVAFFEAHLCYRVGGDDAGKNLASNGEPYLRHQAIYFYFQHASHKLVASADTPEIAPPLRTRLDLSLGNEALQFVFRNAMVTAGRGHGVDFTVIDPLLERGIADAKPHCGISWF